MKTTAFKGVWHHQCNNAAVICFDTNNNHASVLIDGEEIDHHVFPSDIRLSDAEAYINQIEAMDLQTVKTAV